MKKEIIEEIEIPAGVEAEIENNTIKVKGAEGEIQRSFNNIDNLIFEKKGNKIIIGNKKASKKEKKMINTISAHIKNMFMGVKEKFVYELKAVFSHFPITAEVQGRKFLVKNFLGEKIPREVELPEGVEVEIKKEIIIVKSPDIEIAGKAAASIERATKIRLRDRRVFQDGIYLTSKAGKKI